MLPKVKMDKKMACLQILESVIEGGVSSDWSSSGGGILPRMVVILRDNQAIDSTSRSGWNGGTMISILPQGKLLYQYIKNDLLDVEAQWGNAEIVKWSLILTDYAPRYRSQANFLSTIEYHALHYAWRGSIGHKDVLIEHGGNEARLLAQLGDSVSGVPDMQSVIDIDDLQAQLKTALGIPRVQVEHIAYALLYKAVFDDWISNG